MLNKYIHLGTSPQRIVSSFYCVSDHPCINQLHITHYFPLSLSGTVIQTYHTFEYFVLFRFTLYRFGSYHFLKFLCFFCLLYSRFGNWKYHFEMLLCFFSVLISYFIGFDFLFYRIKYSIFFLGFHFLFYIGFDFLFYRIKYQ